MIVSDLLTLTEDLFLSFRLQAYHEVLRLAWVVHIFIWGEHKSQVSCLCIIILALRLQHLVHTAALWTFFQVYLALSASTLHVRAGNAPVSADSTPLGCCTALRWLSERWLHKPGETGSLFNHIRERERADAQEQIVLICEERENVLQKGFGGHWIDKVSAPFTEDFYIINPGRSIFKSLTKGCNSCKQKRLKIWKYLARGESIPSLFLLFTHHQ